MDVIQYILMFFASKHLSLITVFLCWKPEEISELARRGRESGARVRLVAAARLPAMPPAAPYREGLLLDVTCPHADLQLRQASASRAFDLRHSWLLLHGQPYNATTIHDTLSDVSILPNSDVTWLSSDAMVDVYRVKEELPLLLRNLTMRDTLVGMQRMWAKMPTTVTRRKDLHNVTLKAATIVSQPHYFRGWSDVSNRQIDTFPKLTYPLLMLCAEDLNFRYNLKQVDLYGEQRNGSFDGLAGMLQRQELEVGITSMFMRADRLLVLDYVAETVVLKGSFIFRQPSQSTVSNVFLLPFSRGVWVACAVTFASAAALLALFAALARRLPALSHTDASLQRFTPAECCTYAVGTICQQGSDLSPELMSVRVVMFCTLLASLFAFTSYSAKIVAILQEPSDAIQSIADLARSPMPVGVQETTYKRVYFAESRHPATQALYRRKLLPLGERAYLSVVDGIARMRSGFFAFQVEEGSGYAIISKTFTEREKCGLKQIQAFKLPTVAVPVRRHSGYRDLLAARLRWQREIGLMDRSRRVWLSGRPRCEAALGGFVSVGLVDVLPALRALLAGAAAALAALLAERAAHVVRRPRPRPAPH